MADWVKLRGVQLRQALGLSDDKLPHAVTYRRVLGNAVNIEEFERVMGQFFERCGGQTKQLAMDGKRMRGTIANGQQRGVYLLAVYDPCKGVVLNQVNIEEKTNEIGTAPAVLKALDLHGKVVTGDALFTQRELSKHLVEAGGHYLWLVKDNQPTLSACLVLNMFRSVPLPCTPIFNRPLPFVKSTGDCKSIR